jgi:putative radical SAM enzyme (TIGR03279 family)
LCPGINDGKELDNSLQKLGSIYPPIKSISVVPVGLTKHRDKLYKLLQYDKEKSIEVIKQISKWQNIFLQKYGTRVVYTADEFFVMADYTVPEYDEYEDFPQIENGVGLIASFVHEVDDFISNCDDEYFDINEDTISIATGTSFFGTINSISKKLQEKAISLKINVYAIKNEFFGESVTVAGLLTAKDIINQLKQKPLGSRLLISKNALKAYTQIFLDDYTVSDIERELNIKVQIVENNGEVFIKNVLNKHLESG